MSYDCVVIGGGPAGMFAAITAAKNAGQFFVVLWSVRAIMFIPAMEAMPAILFGVQSSSPQGERHE